MKKTILLVLLLCAYTINNKGVTTNTVTTPYPAQCRTFVTLIWDNTNYINDTNISVEIWSSTNLVTWNLKTIIPSWQTNYVVTPLLSTEFFKVRNKDSRSGLVSNWASK
tara:strand:+ start:1548 stop:1874 length:327 start_codon:yes stop_codon:yes gene_type:complete